MCVCNEGQGEGGEMELGCFLLQLLKVTSNEAQYRRERLKEKPAFKCSKPADVSENTNELLGV